MIEMKNILEHYYEINTKNSVNLIKFSWRRDDTIHIY